MLLFERKQVFDKDLLEMKENNFITKETYDQVSKASNDFYANKFELAKIQQPEIKKTKQETIPLKTVIKEQDITERRSSILLNLGVLFLFLSGLIFATTNWNNMEVFGRVSVMIFMGGILSVGSYIADVHLSLKKTGYALWILTTLYIPIVGITFIYSMLWNKVTDISEPKSLLSLAVLSLISSIINYLSINKYQSRFYVWTTYATTELSLLFFAGSLKVEFSGIFLVIVLCNLAIIYSYLKLVTQQYKIYTGEYLKIIGYITLAVALMTNMNTFNAAYLGAVIILFPTLLTTSILIKDKYIEIS